MMVCIHIANAQGKKIKLYQCEQADGTVVTQDRRCQVTRLQQAEAKPVIKASKTPSKSFKTTPSQFIAREKTRAVELLKLNKKARSPYFSIGWEATIPKSWWLNKIENDRLHQLLFSSKALKTMGDFEIGVKLSVYPKTQQNYRQDAFAKALTLYHQIREQFSNQLVNSHFKSHKRFKIFNIEYKIKNNIKAFTEFYIDEFNNDLFVITIQSPAEQWQQHLNLAHIIQSSL